MASSRGGGDRDGREWGTGTTETEEQGGEGAESKRSGRASERGDAARWKGQNNAAEMTAAAEGKRAGEAGRGIVRTGERRKDGRAARRRRPLLLR